MENIIKKGKILTGTVFSSKMKDTTIVLVERYEKHPKYKKHQNFRKKYKVHDPANKMKDKVGEKVEIREVAPISKTKNFIFN